MNYSGLRTDDMANGYGVRVTLFVSGCRIHCKNCFNQKAQDFKYGKVFDEEAKNFIFSELDKSYIEGLTILGGEPFEPENQECLIDLIKEIKLRYPNKTIWMYTGYVYNKTIPQTKYLKEILNNIDVLVDGPFIEELKNPTLKFRGSANQRLIDMNLTKINTELILYDK